MLRIYDVKFFLSFGDINYFCLLETFLFVKRYLYRSFNYFISFIIKSSKIVKKKKISVLRSSFVHKVSQEHFLFSFYKLNIFLKFFFFFTNVLQIYWLFIFLQTLIKKVIKNIFNFYYTYKKN